MDPDDEARTAAWEAEVRARLTPLWARHCGDLDPATFERVVHAVVGFGPNAVHLQHPAPNERINPMPKFESESAVDEIARVFEVQRAHRWRTKASSADARIAKLRRLRDAVAAHAAEFNDALYADLRRPREAPASLEAAVVLADLDHAIAHLLRWMAPVEVEPASLLPGPPMPGARRFVQHEGRGVVLIFGAWNQPFMLLLQPLVAAIAAGNTAIVKPNELSPASSQLIATIIREAFGEEDVAAFEGGVDLADRLLDFPVDHIFFTGSPAVGRRIAAAAARTLASTTLELGGKSPAIVDGSTDLAETAAVIAAGKFYNAGQVCITVDHVWVHRDARDAFVEHYMRWVRAHLYDGDALRPGALAAMVNRRNFDRVTGYIADATGRGATLIGTGGQDAETLTIEPGVLVDVPLDAAIMRDEVFGPLLPVVTFDAVDEVITHLRAADKPLAMYPFTTDAALVDRLLAETSSGGLTANAWAAHAFESTLPFGGVGNSGSGHYRGEYGFRALSHARGVVTLTAPFDSVAAVAG